MPISAEIVLLVKIPSVMSICFGDSSVFGPRFLHVTSLNAFSLIPPAFDNELLNRVVDFHLLEFGLFYVVARY